MAAEPSEGSVAARFTEAKSSLAALHSQSKGSVSFSVSEPLSSRMVSLAGVDLDGFWGDWDAHRAKLQHALSRYTLQQEQLVKNLLVSMHSTHAPAEAPRKSFAASRSSSSVTVESPAGVVSEEEAPERAPEAPPEITATEDGGDIDLADTWKSDAPKPDFQILLDEAQMENSTMADVAPQWMLNLVRWWSELEEPPRTGRLSKIIQHRYFDMMISVVITCNAIYTAYQSNYEMDNLGLQPPASDRPIETTFLCCYSLELALKLMVHRQYYFCNNDMSWNMFDFVLVLLSICDATLTYMGESFGSVTFARSLRLFKMGKILRIFRAMRFLKELRVMVASIIGSFSSLFWSFVMIGMILYVFALFFIQQMAAELDKTADLGGEVWDQQRYFFRTVERTILTLLQSTMGGLDWENIFVLVEPLGLPYVMAFIFYIAFFNFAVVNILTGIFVENAMKLCKPDQHEIVAEEEIQNREDVKELRRVMMSMDADGDGMVTKDEFVQMTQRDEVARVFAALGIDLSDPELFFQMLVRRTGRHGAERVTIDTFVERAMAMKGLASSVVVHGLMYQASLLEQRLDSMKVQHSGRLRKCEATEKIPEESDESASDLEDTAEYHRDQGSDNFGLNSKLSL